MTTYARLSALDRSFLDLEDSNTHMHVGATCIFEAGSWRRADGGIDVDRLRRYVESRLYLFPRYRQRLAATPLEGHPVWVDDDSFDLSYHVRLVGVPKPGDDRELKRLAGWINSQQLDRTKPLWEMWVIEGLERDRFALVAKTHHCLIDGLAGVDLLSVMLCPSVVATEISEAPAWRPRPAPSALRLGWDAALRRVLLPLRSLGTLARNPARSWSEALDLASALYTNGLASLCPGADTPLNHPVGRHRRFDWFTVDLERIKAAGKCLGGTINEVVLAAVTGGMRDYLAGRGVAIDSRFVFRTLCPVGLQSGRRGKFGGNFLATMIAELPLQEADPLRQLGRIRQSMRGRKDSAPAHGIEVLESVTDELFPSLLAVIGSIVESSIAYNLIVTNVPGPQFPLYLLGSRMLVSYPLVPLFGHQGVGIALLSYNRQLCWGFNADRDLVPDLHELVEGVRLAFERLCVLADLPLEEGVRSATNAFAAAAAAATGKTKTGKLPQVTTPAADPSIAAGPGGTVSGPA